jgi:hypothetical protein
MGVLACQGGMRVYELALSQLPECDERETFMADGGKNNGNEKVSNET